MDTKKTVLSCLERVSGISEAELSEAADLDLVAEGVLDSLAVVSLLSMLEKALGCTLETGRFSMGDFTSADSIVKAVEEKKR